MRHIHDIVPTFPTWILSIYVFVSLCILYLQSHVMSHHTLNQWGWYYASHPCMQHLLVSLLPPLLSISLPRHMHLLSLSPSSLSLRVGGTLSTLALCWSHVSTYNNTYLVLFSCSWYVDWCWWMNVHYNELLRRGSTLQQAVMREGRERI